MRIKHALLPGFLVVLSLSWIPGYSAPNTTNAVYSGSLVSGTTITITGTTFGSTGPTPVLYDSFETGIVGSSISILANGASYVGAYSEAGSGSEGPIYSNIEKYSGSQSMASDFSTGGNGGAKYAAIALSSTTQLFYCHDWKITGDWTGYDNVSGVNTKDPWLMFGNSTTDADIYPGYTSSSLNEAPEQWLFDSNDNTSTPKFTSFNTSTTSAVAGSTEGWHQACWWVMGNGTGEMRFYSTTATGTIKLNYSTGSLAVPFFDEPSVQSTYWNNVHVMGFGRLETGTTYYHDNVYVSTGNASGVGSAAHVWIMDQPTIDNSSKWVVLKPITWSDGTVTAMLPTNNFSGGETGYIFVCDSDFSCDDTGFQITMGASQIILPTNPITQIKGLTLKGITIR